MRASYSRSTFIYVIWGMALLMIIWRGFFLATESVATTVFIRLGLVPFAVAVIIRLLLQPNYIMLDGPELTIYRTFFTKETFNIDSLVKIQLSDSPFKKSYFVMANYVKYEFNYFELGEKSFKALIEKLEKLEKPIEHI